ncbi:HIG1 domain family member 2A, mitochondrial [Scleropages formosus]|nr:HIG1 domain family member 2A, mitochondrial [Scleropages formosus]
MVLRPLSSGRFAVMAATTNSVEQVAGAKSAPSPNVPLELGQPPVIEGFAPRSRARDEGFMDKFARKTKENPFVPLGCLATAATLTYGLISFKQGKTRQSQLLMRGRIFAQGFTVVAIVVGVAAAALKPKQ